MIRDITTQTQFKTMSRPKVFGARFVGLGNVYKL